MEMELTQLQSLTLIGTTTTTTVRDGKSPKLEIVDNKDGSHTVKVTGADGKEKTTLAFW